MKHDAPFTFNSRFLTLIAMDSIFHYTASLTRNRSRRAAHGSIPRGYSTANGELTNQVITSLLGFYGTSEVLSVSEPQFPLDTASIVERIVLL